MLLAADGRMKLVGQFLAGVRVIKMYHWEQPQEAEINKCRCGAGWLVAGWRAGGRAGGGYGRGEQGGWGCVGGRRRYPGPGLRGWPGTGHAREPDCCTAPVARAGANVAVHHLVPPPHPPPLHTSLPPPSPTHPVTVMLRSEELRALRNMIPSKVAMQTLLYVLPQLAGVLSLLAVALTNPEVRQQGGGGG